MSMRHIPEADQIDYHADREVQRVERAKRLIDPGDVLAVLDSRIAAEPDPKAHPLYEVVLFALDRQTAVHGGDFWQRCHQLVLAAIDTWPR